MVDDLRSVQDISARVAPPNVFDLMVTQDELEQVESALSRICAYYVYARAEYENRPPEPPASASVTPQPASGAPQASTAAPAPNYPLWGRPDPPKTDDGLQELTTKGRIGSVVLGLAACILLGGIGAAAIIAWAALVRDLKPAVRSQMLRYIIIGCVIGMICYCIFVSYMMPSLITELSSLASGS
jgi:hypothetical protein